MLKNYFKIALRHISRNKGYVFINVIGLGIALACTMIAFVNWQAGEYADNFHENYNDLYRVVAEGVGHGRPTCDIDAMIVPLASIDIPGVKAGVRYKERGVVVQYDDKVLGEGMAFADANFFDVFTFPIVLGDPDALNDPSKVVISQKIAKKYFGEEDPIGKTFIINPNEEESKQLTVGGVIEDIPGYTSSLDFNFITNINFLENSLFRDTLTNWHSRTHASFLLLDKGVSEETVTQQLAQYVPMQNEATRWDKRTKYFLLPMKEIFMLGDDLNNNWINSGVAPSFYWGPWVMALMILFTACLNFTNTTVSFSNKRLKEMGVRKVMGSGRTQLVLQLLGECFVICLMATLLGVLLAEYLLPLYNAMWEDVNLGLTLDYFGNPYLLLFVIGILLGTTLIGGAYPAFYISSFRPSHIFRGSTKFGGDNWFVRSLLGLQIATCLVAIIGGISFYQNAVFQKEFDLGYNVDGIINVSLRGGETYEKFKNVISQNPDVKGITGSRNNLGFGNWWSNVGDPEDNRHAQNQLVGENFFEVMGIKLLEGRTFDKNLETDFSEKVVITKKFLEEWKWDKGVGKRFKHYYDKEKTVIGVVDDIYASSFFNDLAPNVFHLVKPKEFGVMKIKVPAKKMVAMNKLLKENWTETFPFLPYNSYYQDEAKAQTITIVDNVASLNLFIAIITILLAATGLFSLVSLNVLKRAKEIAVRRVLGASPENITYIVNKHYMLVFGVASILGAGLGGWFVDFLLDELFDVYKSTQVSTIILSVVLICLVGMSTVGSKIFRVLQTNPAETLKSE